MEKQQNKTQRNATIPPGDYMEKQTEQRITTQNIDNTTQHKNRTQEILLIPPGDSMEELGDGEFREILTVG